MTQEENRRLLVLGQVQEGAVTVAQAAEALGLSRHQTQRLLAGFRRDGAAALAHGNRGRTPKHALPLDLRQQVLTLAQTTYQGVNYRHLSELLAEREAILLSRSSVRRILLGAGIRSPHKRRPPKHRSLHERMPQAGLMLLIDGSYRHWLGDAAPPFTLVGAKRRSRNWPRSTGSTPPSSIGGETKPWRTCPRSSRSRIIWGLWRLTTQLAWLKKRYPN